MRTQPHTPTDGELVAACRRGEPGAWPALIDRLTPLAFTVARESGLSDDRAADAVQETFVALFEQLGAITEPEAVAKWVIVVARRRASRIRGKAAQTAHSLDAAEPATRAVSADDALADLELRRRAWGLLDRLGGRCKELLASLFGRHQTDYDHIAETLGMPRGAIGPTRARCLAKLAELMDAGTE